MTNEKAEKICKALARGAGVPELGDIACPKAVDVTSKLIERTMDHAFGRKIEVWDDEGNVTYGARFKMPKNIKYPSS